MYINKNYININFYNNPGGIIILISGLICIFAVYIFLPLGILTFLIFLYFLIILRTTNDNLHGTFVDTEKIFAPIDGNIINIREENNKKVIVFKPEIFSSQIQYSPVVGMIYQQIWYHGTFYNNENNDYLNSNAKREFTFETHKKNQIILIQTSNPICRFMLSFIREGLKVSPKNAIGLSLFMGNVEIHLPSNYKINILVGQRCLARETIVANII